MQTEFEIKVLDIDTDAVSKLLISHGFKKQAPQNFKRYVYNLQTDGAWLRLRTDGSLTSLTYKHAQTNAIDGVKELEIEVSDFEKMNQLLELSGYVAETYQENNRVCFTLDTIEVSIDSWPQIPAYLEIEAKDKATVETWLQKLSLDSHRTTSEPTSKVYELYGINLSDFPVLKFDK